jgi:hypothetical protein
MGFRLNAELQVISHSTDIKTKFVYSLHTAMLILNAVFAIGAYEWEACPSACLISQTTYGSTQANVGMGNLREMFSSDFLLVDQVGSSGNLSDLYQEMRSSNLGWDTDYLDFVVFLRPSSSGVGELFWVLPQNIFVYNDITP